MFGCLSAALHLSSPPAVPSSASAPLYMKTILRCHVDIFPCTSLTIDDAAAIPGSPSAYQVRKFPNTSWVVFGVAGRGHLLLHHPIRVSFLRLTCLHQNGPASQPPCTRTHLHESSQLVKSTRIKAFAGAILNTSSPDANLVLLTSARCYECTGIEVLYATTQHAHLAEARRCGRANPLLCPHKNSAGREAT